MKKLNKNKIYAFIGKTILVILADLMWTGLIVYGIMTATTLN